jgi:ATP adenylyltransferase
METHADVRTDVRRFEALLEGRKCTPTVYDQILMETHGCVVTPTLGSILPNWLLVVPRSPTINFAQWQDIGGAGPSEVVTALLAKHDIDVSRAIWFEHGPPCAGSALGCGVDQAHLHVIIDAPFTFEDFISEAERASAFEWAAGKPTTVHGSIDPDVSYLFAAWTDRAIVAQNVESVGSQFFRRVIANLVRKPGEWNYRSHPHLGNVHVTIRRFGGYSSKIRDSDRPASV